MALSTSLSGLEVSPDAINKAKMAKLRAVAERNKAQRAPQDPIKWTQALFPKMVSSPFAKRHIDMLEWAWALEKGVRPLPFVSIQPRGGGKSTNSELAVIMAGAREARRYAWYVSETQSLADAHLESIAGMIESPIIEAYYPSFARPHFGKFGSAKAWRRNRLRTGNGFTIDALGLDTAKRGTKLVENRPDFMIFDDIDGRHDGINVTQKKIDTITTSLLPAGSSDLAILFVQNLIIDTGVFADLSSSEPSFLRNRILSGPYKALEKFEWWYDENGTILINGQPTWAGQDLEICQQQVNEWGLSAFRREAQHEIIYEGGVFSHLKFIRIDPLEDIEFWRIVVAVDPAVTATDASAAHGCVVAAIDQNETIYFLDCWEQQASPEIALKKALSLAEKWNADKIMIEANQGGDLWNLLWDNLADEYEGDYDVPSVELVTASSGTGSKIERASQLCADYETGFVKHMNTPNIGTLESALYRFPLAKPFDLVDSAWWAWKELREGASWLIA